LEIIGDWETRTEELEKNSVAINQASRDFGKILKPRNKLEETWK
jgi:hypothetical protein